MTREEHKALIQNIMNNASNQAELSLLLTQLSEDYEKVLTESETSASSLATLTKDNEQLRSVNMQLFLKVGHEKPKTEEQKTEVKEENNDNLSYDTLFDEKGVLK